jgi:hypothetical protein
VSRRSVAVWQHSINGRRGTPRSYAQVRTLTRGWAHRSDEESIWRAAGPSTAAHAIPCALSSRLRGAATPRMSVLPNGDTHSVHPRVGPLSKAFDTP